MRICVFEDCAVAGTEPLGRSHPAFQLASGKNSLLKEQCRYFAASEVGVLVRPALAERWRWENPTAHVNDLGWLRAADTVLVNWRWVPPSGKAEHQVESSVALIEEEVAYVLVGPWKLTYCSPNTLDDCLRTWRQMMPCRNAPGQLLPPPSGLARTIPSIAG